MDIVSGIVRMSLYPCKVPSILLSSMSPELRGTLCRQLSAIKGPLGALCVPHVAMWEALQKMHALKACSRSQRVSRKSSSHATH